MTTANRFRFRRTIDSRRAAPLPPVLVAMTLAAGVAAAACGSSAGSNPTGGSMTISTQPLAGTIGGQPWAFVTGETDAFLSSADEFFTTLYPTTFTACSLGGPTDVSEVLLELPTAPGSYDLSLGMNATLYDTTSDTNWVAIRGRVVVDSVTATTVTGGMHLIYDANNNVDGQFQVTICP